MAVLTLTRLVGCRFWLGVVFVWVSFLVGCRFCLGVDFVYGCYLCQIIDLCFEVTESFQIKA